MAEFDNEVVMYENIDEVIYSKGVLLENSYSDEELLDHVWAISNGKFLHYDINVTKEFSNDLGITSIVPIVNNCKVILIKNNKQQLFFLDIKDVLSFPSSYKFEVDLKKIKLYNLSIIPKIEHGVGNKKFKVFVDFRDRYSVEILSNSKEEAIEQSKTINLSYWSHDFDPLKRIKSGDNVIRIVRFSHWDHDMIEAEEL
jgi:hypothetical protein